MSVSEYQRQLERRCLALDDRAKAAESRLVEIEAANVGLANESVRLQAALTFYAERKHIELSEPGQWDNPDDEASNWLCDAAGTATIEDGWMAREALKPFTVTADSATACLGGAPHWWDINANTGLPECRLCHKSPDPSAKESL